MDEQKAVGLSASNGNNTIVGNGVGSPMYSFLPVGFDALAELALDMRWSWNNVADAVWRQIDPMLWDITHNSWIVLQTASREKIEQVLADPVNRKTISSLIKTKRDRLNAPAWFQNKYPNAPLTCVAYFSMEFMLSEALPIYSGGLGNVAGDQLKAASDLGVPVIGIGLLYQQGYFRQSIGKDGAQHELYPYNDPGQLPITPVRQPNGEWLRLEVPLPGYPIWLRVWQVQVGRTKLYLLDSNDQANYPIYRGITSELYGGGLDLRLKQEMVLGLGGWSLLQKLGINPEVCHLNEGHAAFAVLERARYFMDATHQPFDVALAVTRAGNLFTTHTAVPAGFDLFDPALIKQHLGNYAKDRLHINIDEFLALGRKNPNDPTENFNMAYLAMRGSGSVNGVSRLHGKVSRRIFEPLFKRWAEEEVPIGYITNGVHMPSWSSKAANEFWTKACGNEIWLEVLEAEHLEKTEKIIEEKVKCVTDLAIWQMRTKTSEIFVEYIRDQLFRQLSAIGVSSANIEHAKTIFDPKVLTLGFARRFASYKRPNLLLHDPERLLRILSNSKRPVQLVIAGKAHPKDKIGQSMIKEWIHFIVRPEVRQHVVFLSDYDMLLTEHLVQGVDVWLNTPRRPWEASGTSGMKVLVNGGINFSELDGWWAEAYAQDVGWSLGDGEEHDEDPAWDAREAEELYNKLENEIIPEFYNRDENGLPIAWIARMRESMARLTPQFSSSRSVREYTEKHYLPAAKSFHERAANNSELGKKIFDWLQVIEQKWYLLRFGAVKIEEGADNYKFEVEVFLNGLDASAVRVELYADAIGDNGAVHQEMTILRQPKNHDTDFYIYTANVKKNRPSSDYTARVIPHFEGIAVPLEAAQILWQR